MFAVAGAFWVADIFTACIRMDATGIRVVHISKFVCRTIAREQIDEVTWARGCDASLILRGGGRVGLPNLTGNAQALANTVRAWLEKPEALR